LNSLLGQPLNIRYPYSLLELLWQKNQGHFTLVFRRCIFLYFCIILYLSVSWNVSTVKLLNIFTSVTN
jgi:hypothetical protein